MIFYRTGQSWFPRKLDSLEPGKLVLFICNSKPHRGQEGVERGACRMVLDAWEVLVALHLGCSMLGQGLPRKVG